MVIREAQSAIDLVLFDFGGVLAEEGFAKGLRAIAARNGLDEEAFYSTVHALIYKTGYIVGKATESAFWQAVRESTGIREEDAVLRADILSRFILRPWMIAIVRKLTEAGIGAAILSDQTNWLDELNARDHFFHYFEAVFNSYYLGKTKHELSHFSDVLACLNCEPNRLLFVDDTRKHCETAQTLGLKAICFAGRDSFLKEISAVCPVLQGEVFI